MSNRPLVPDFIQKLDHKWLVNKPSIWATRVHLVLWFTFLFTVVIAGISYFAFYDAAQYYDMDGWFTVIGLATSVGFIVWLIFLLRFNVFKRYGQWLPWDGLRSFVLYFVCIGAMVLVYFVPYAVQTLRAVQQFGHEELINDINTANLNVSRLEKAILPKVWAIDTCIVVDTSSVTSAAADQVTPTEIQPETETAVEPDTVSNSINYDSILERQVWQRSHIDSFEYRNKMAEADSVRRLNDSTVIFYKCPTYNFISFPQMYEHGEQEILRSPDIYRRVILSNEKIDRTKLMVELETIKKKYNALDRYRSEEDYGINKDDTYDIIIIKKYRLARVSDGIDNVAWKQYQWNKWPEFLRIFYYTSLVISLLIFMFRHSTLKTFFLTLLAGVLLTIVTIMLTINLPSSSETILCVILMLYYIAFAIGAFSILQTKTRSLALGICLNFFYVMTPFMPLLIYGFVNTLEWDNYNYRYDQNFYYYELWPYVEIGGGILFLLLLEPVFRRLYRKWYAAPEN